MKLDEAAIIEAIAQGTLIKEAGLFSKKYLYYGSNLADLPNIVILQGRRIPLFSRYIQPVFDDQPINKITSIHIHRRQENKLFASESGTAVEVN